VSRAFKQFFKQKEHIGQLLFVVPFQPENTRKKYFKAMKKRANSIRFYLRSRSLVASGRHSPIWERKVAGTNVPWRWRLSNLGQFSKIYRKLLKNLFTKKISNILLRARKSRLEN